MGPLTALWRDKLLQYTWLRALQGRNADFWQVTGDALEFALETLGLANDALRRQLMDLYLTLRGTAAIWTCGPSPIWSSKLRWLRG
jgi:2-haloacid dehalogenase